jgi:tetratricopeptide (TPR) repeat protein
MSMSSVRISFRQKIVLILCGIVISMVLLEVGLRMFGWVILTGQGMRNRCSMTPGGEYRILCIGESTTADSLGVMAYPRQLEKILNARSLGLNFSVINAGVAGLQTDQIITKLSFEIHKYRPHLVVAMMGINDYLDELQHISGWRKVWRSLRTAALLKMLRERLLRYYYLWRLRICGDNYKRFFERGLLFEKEWNFPEALFWYSKAVTIAPDYPEVYAHLGLIYKFMLNSDGAEKMFLRAIALGYDNKPIRNDLGDIFHDKGDLVQSMYWYEKALEFDPNDYPILFKLGCRLMDVSEFAEAERIFLKAIDSKPFCNGAYNMLAVLYLETGRNAEAKVMFEKISELDSLYAAAGYHKNGDMERSREVIEKLKASGTSEVDPDKQCQELIGRIATFESGTVEVQRFFEDVEMRRQSEYCSKTQTSYQKLRQLAEREQFDIVCMQYPVRSVEPIKRMVGEGKGIYFLSNEDNFKKVLESERYDHIFTDIFAGDFGHCTDKGNQLIAKNLAQLIERDILSQNRHVQES